MTFNRTRTILAAVAIATVAVISAGPTSRASAADECGGNLIFTKAIRDNQDRKVGELNVYYSAATGMNCAKTMHAGRTWDKKMYTSVQLRRCYQGVGPGDPCFGAPENIRSDHGNFAFYAGPVKINAENRCIWAIGHVGDWYASTRPDQNAAFCG